MNQNAREVMACRIETIELTIERMRHPCEWMPVCRVGGSKCPAKRFPGESLLHLRVLDDVSLIVIVHERVAQRTAVNRKCDRQKQEANADSDCCCSPKKARRRRVRNIRRQLTARRDAVGFALSCGEMRTRPFFLGSCSFCFGRHFDTLMNEFPEYRRIAPRNTLDRMNREDLTSL